MFNLDYLENLYGEVESLYMQGYCLEEITQRLFPKKHPIVAFSEGECDSFPNIKQIIIYNRSHFNQK
jgi:endoribonuclease LACTB2